MCTVVLICFFILTVYKHEYIEVRATSVHKTVYVIGIDSQTRVVL